MIIFRDLFSNDELASDTFPHKCLDGVVYEITCKLITETTDIDDSLIGGNKSAEEQGEDNQAASVSGVDVVLANRLVETGFKKKAYKVHIKDYVTRVMAKLEGDELAVFKTNIQKHVKNILEDFDEYQFFMGESVDENSMMIPLKYDGQVPKMYLFKHGLIEEKV